MDFTTALTQTADEIKRPAAMPTGHYNWQVSGPHEQEEFESRNTGDTFIRIRIPMTCIGPVDVDEDELAEFGNVNGQKLFKSFLFNTNPDKKNEMERSLYNLKRFLVDHLGMDESASIEELLANMQGESCIGEVTHRPDQNDPEVVYAELGRTATAE